MKKSLRNIYVFLHGTSIELVDQNIEHLADHNVDFASLNRFSILEDKILSKVNKNFDLIYCSSAERTEQEYARINKHVERGGILMTNHEIAFKYNFQKAICSSLGYGFSSLFAMLVNLMKIGYPRIYLFGADGYASSPDNVYFGQECYEDEDFRARQGSIYRDTEIMNKYFWELVDYWGVKKTEVINVGMDSKITCFDKCTIFDVLA